MQNMKKQTALCVIALLAGVLIACNACAHEQPRSAESQAQDDSSALQASDVSNDVAPSSGDRSKAAELEPGSLAYPTGWLIVEQGGIAPGVPCQILYAPALGALPHHGGSAITQEEMEALKETWPACPEGSALIQRDGATAVVPQGMLLVNLPDVLPQAVYDVVYSYASTSNCAGQSIPGVTGQRLPGYANGIQPNAYVGEGQFVVPCACETAVKLAQVAEALAAQDLKLLVYDAYRPMAAQMYLSQSFEQAYYSNSAISDSLGEWGLTWYVANGPSGHNFGTDVDVGACDAQGAVLEMPSAFDAFDESGHLTTAPMSASGITSASYRQEVLGNRACMALHEAFTQAGFSELASEWWHFADEPTEAQVRSIVGDGGLDFEANLG